MSAPSPALAPDSAWVWPARLVGVLAVGLLVALGAGSLVVQFFLRESTTTRTVPVQGLATVSVGTDTGTITVTRRADAGTVLVVLTRRTAFQDAVVEQEVRGDTLAVRARCDDAWAVAQPCSVDVDLAVPDGLAVELRSSTGDVVVVGTAGPVTARTAAGDVEIADVRSDAVSAQVATGDIEISLRNAPAGVRARAAAGDVRVVVPADGTSYRVRAESAVSRPTVDVPQEPTGERVIDVSTALGDITVTTRRSADD